MAFRSGEEFREALTYLLAHPVESTAMGRQGLRYVEQEYCWPTVLGRVEALLRRVVAKRERAAHAPVEHS